MMSLDSEDEFRLYKYQPNDRRAKKFKPRRVDSLLIDLDTAEIKHLSLQDD